MNRCDICLEETCGGKHNCHCETCNHSKDCYRFLHATIRITNRCTQECSHCCFESNKTSSIFMSIDLAKDIGKFLKSNDVMSLNVVGGEFFTNKDWFEILNIFLENTLFVRLVSNGDWAKNDDVKEKLKILVEKYKDSFHISISKDVFHTNAFLDEAALYLESINANFNIGDDTNSTTKEALVPIGRAYGSCNLYGLVACYCHNPSKMYSFLIDEEGNIYKCSFGVWNYANVKEFLDGGFAKRFKEFNKKFYSIFVPSCSSCINCAVKKDDNIVKTN